MLWCYVPSVIAGESTARPAKCFTSLTIMEKVIYPILLLLVILRQLRGIGRPSREFFLMSNWIELQQETEASRLGLIGNWRIGNVPAISTEISTLKTKLKLPIEVNGDKLEALDTAGVMVLLKLIRWKDASSQITFVNFKPAQETLLRMVIEHYQPSGKVVGTLRLPLVPKLGRAAIDLAEIVFSILAFVGETLLSLFKSLANPRSMRIKELFAQLEYVCLDAIPIVCLVTFLIGVVIAYLFGVQIEKYGGNIFIVDGTAIAMCRELSPILVAIIVAGRSGSAFTAQIGTMKLNEEVDALKTLGLGAMPVLVIPRVLALIIAMPLLVFVGDVVGILGSMVVADLRLNVTGYTFLERLRVILTMRSFFVGLIKAPVFALFIAIIGCHLGLTVANDARSIGMSTTATVVRSIVAVILLNAAFAVLFVELRI